MFEQAIELLELGRAAGEPAQELLRQIGFRDRPVAWNRLLEICGGSETRQAIAPCLPALLAALSESPNPDGSLINFERFVQNVPHRLSLFHFLAANPRAVEILVRLFVGSQFLTEILLRNPGYLELLTRHRRLADFKSRAEFTTEGMAEARQAAELEDQLDALRRYQRWELLRIGACDTFNLMDLKSTTIQLSLLADSMVQSCLNLLADDEGIDPSGLVVLGFGKLGGEELNYSSDIDLVFLSDSDAARFWRLGQRLIKTLMDTTAEGFLYRVDMRLRPWGRSGALVNTVEGHLQYLQQHAALWEKQALLKARPIAGDLAVGGDFLEAAERLVFAVSPDEVRANVADTKARIESDLLRQGRSWGEVKSGPGSIRDIEFVTQYLQLVNGREHPSIRSFNTLDGLVRLADFDLLRADEYRILSSAYVFLRTVEHSLQLMHNKQTHTLPTDRRELTYLAGRLDYPDADEFLRYYEQHVAAVRQIYEKYLSDSPADEAAEQTPPEDPVAVHLRRMSSSYAQIFDEQQIQRHLALLERLSVDHVTEVAARPLEDGLWEVLVVGFDAPGDLSVICGLLFVYGFDIVSGQVFTDEHVTGRRVEAAVFPSRSADPASWWRFVNVFIVRPPDSGVREDVWRDYQEDLSGLLHQVYRGHRQEAQGLLAKRVARVMRGVVGPETTLYPVHIDVDNSLSDHATVLHIRSDDTIGFLYELSNALTMTGIDISRVIVSSSGSSVLDTLYVTDQSGARITDPNRLNAIRAAVVLIKHFTHLLPRSPNPEAALLHFREFLENLFARPDWFQELSALEDSEVLAALARLLGVSDFLWQDFLRLQHENLFPVVRDIHALKQRRRAAELARELAVELDQAADLESARTALNAFKDRQMFRSDMRHILGFIEEFGQFSLELTDVAEVVVAGALRICERELQARFGNPRLQDGTRCPMAVVALGKCGGRELGFASDIELMFIYEGEGETDGAEQLSNSDYFVKLVDLFSDSIQARREGVFQLDLRLRPYGRAGSRAVSREAFTTYFAPQGAAWPYERQALVKLRAIAGDRDFGRRLETLRSELVYVGDPFDVAAMRGMRERQVRQLVSSGTINAKLSPGALVDCEYLVQGLQITHGHLYPSLRTTNTLGAMRALHEVGILGATEFQQLKSAYIFQRRLIDALRMVRGHARDLTVPDPESEEFEFLSERLGYGDQPGQLAADLEHSCETVLELSRLLDVNAR